MARYTADHKGETRKRILETAGRRFKRDGIDGSGIAAIMSDAQLTNGAFYAHFKSATTSQPTTATTRKQAAHQRHCSMR